MGQYWAVPGEYWLINRSIAGEMNTLAKCINFNRMRASSEWILLGSALPKGRVSITQRCNNLFKSLLSELPLAADMERTMHYNRGQRNVNDNWSCKYSNWKVLWLLLCITDILAAFMGRRDSDTVTAVFWQWASTDTRWLLAFHHGYPMWWFVENIHKWSIGCRLWQKQLQHTPCPILKMSVNRESTMFGVASCWSNWRMIAHMYKWGSGRLYRQTQSQHTPYPILKMSVQWVSMIFHLASVVT